MFEIPKIRWDTKNNIDIPTSDNVKNFLEDIIKLSEKYNLSISHEDGHGAFILEQFDYHNINWLSEAMINI